MYETTLFGLIGVQRYGFLLKWQSSTLTKCAQTGQKGTLLSLFNITRMPTGQILPQKLTKETRRNWHFPTPIFSDTRQSS